MTTAIIKTLRASQGFLQAEVRVGFRDNGGEVVNIVKLSRRSEEVQEAMRTLENLLLREAQAVLTQAATREQVRDLADQRAKQLVEAANTRSYQRVVNALTDILGKTKRRAGMVPSTERSMWNGLIEEIEQQINTNNSERRTA